jgi:hypothetical protein
MADNNIKTYPVVPGGNIQMESLPPEANEAKDAAMGRYMDAFSRLEGMIHIAISDILQIDFNVLGSVFATLMTKQSIDLLEAVAQEHLTEEGAAKVHKICERLGRRNMRRNHIVHGAWVQFFIIGDEVATQEWVRCYQHVNPALRKLPYTDPKMAGMYAFTIPGLDKATDHVQEMTEAVSALIGDLPSLRLPPQTPEQ